MAFNRPRFDVADIVRLHRDALEARYSLNRQQRRVLTAIGQCRTAALGGHKDVCENGDFEQISYNSLYVSVAPNSGSHIISRGVSVSRGDGVGQLHGIERVAARQV